MKIKIAKELSLPIDAITQTFAQIGRKGAGKTYLASMIAEQMLDAQAQVIVIDPIGNWWGLRVDADGKSKGKDIFIIGGTHGDVQLASEGGREIAKLLVEKKISVVLDISEFRKNERKRFVTDFAEEFYHLKKTHASAVHIFLEESQKFVPQRVLRDDTRMLGAWEDIVRLGRNYGIGCSLISQRPQSVNKEVLSQVECLCVLQLTGLHERKALEEWIQEAGEDRKIVGSLPSLHQGEGYVWSPSWLRIFDKVHFNKKTTFDTSATPKLGEATKSAKISKMDIENLKKQMINVTTKITDDKKDKKSLLEQINELKRKLRESEHSKPKPEIDERALERAKIQGYKEAENTYRGHTAILERKLKDYQRKGKKVIELFGGNKDIEEFSFENKPQALKVSKPEFTKNEVKPIMEQTNRVEDDMDYKYELKPLGLCEKKLYSLLYQYSDRSFSKQQIGVFTGYKYTSGGFNNAVCRLRNSGLIQGSGNLLKVKEINPEIAGDFDFSKEAIINKLAKCEKEIYEVLLKNPYETFGKEELARNTPSDYSPTSGGFNNAICRLNTFGLIQRKDGKIKLNPELLEI